jgi:uncharacterized C2H2 Zn-finger protein
VGEMIKCPYCSYEGNFKILKKWRFRFYDVNMMQCPRCDGVFNYYLGLRPGGEKSEFVIRIRPRPEIIRKKSATKR